MAHVNWRVHRKRNVAEHSAVAPDVAAAFPKDGMLDSLLFAPCPACAGPQRTVAVTAVLHEVQELTIGDVLIFDTECGYANRQKSALVIPSKSLGIGRQSECCRSFWNFHQVMPDAWRAPVVLGSTSFFHCQRQPMKHVGQSLRVHQAVFD